mgnify:CR=1 FL=1
MKKYFITIGKEKKGPYSIEELKKMELTDKYLIWSEDLGDWKTITEIEELSNTIIKTPPPTPAQKKSQEKKNSTIEALKISCIAFIIIAIVVYFVMGGYLNDSELKDKYGYGEYAVYGEGWQIRENLMYISAIGAFVISLIIFYFSYNNQINKKNETDNSKNAE